LVYGAVVPSSKTFTEFILKCISFLVAIRGSAIDVLESVMIAMTKDVKIKFGGRTGASF
jgi:hypothetical protein